MLGKPKKVVLASNVFQKVKEAHTTQHSDFNEFMNNFNNHLNPPRPAAAKRRRKGKNKKPPAPQPVAFSDFTFDGITDRQRSMSKVLPNAETIVRATLDGVEFRTEASCRKIRTDNSWIEMECQRDAPGQSARRRNKVTETYSTFGRIQKMYRHRLAPELDEEVFIDCKWYELAEDAPALPSGLPQVQYNRYWERSSLVALRVCRPVSLVCWPSDPFDDDNDLLCVIRHHEKVD